MNPRILLVDDHALFRAGLRSLLQAGGIATLITEAEDGITAVERAGEAMPDLVIMDLHLPDQDGIGVSRQILARHPSSRIIILSGESNLSFVNQALQAGVSGYLLKTNAAEELPRAVDAVLSGRLFLCPEANAFVLENHRQNLFNNGADSEPVLSDREREVLCLIADGLRAKEIAARFELSVKTIETYRQRLMKKLRLSSTAELVRYAVREGMIKP